MESSIKLDEKDVRKIIADYFKVGESAVLKTKFSYFVVGAKASEILPLQQND